MDYEDLKLKEFDHWNLFLHERQMPYIGRSYAWAKDVRRNHLRDMTGEERNDLFDAVIPHWEKAMDIGFGNIRTNLAILGNTSPHLHAHLIPRHKHRVIFDGKSYEDPNPTGNYAPYPKVDLPKKELLSIRDFMIKRL